MSYNFRLDTIDVKSLNGISNGWVPSKTEKPICALLCPEGTS